MTDMAFKTPLPHYTAKSSSESEDSTDGTSTNTGSANDLSIVAMFDDLSRLQKHSLEDKERMQDAFLNFAKETERLWLQWKTATEECQRLNGLLQAKLEENSELDRCLTQARIMLDDEKKRRKQTEKDRDEFRLQIAKFCNTLMRDNRNKLAEDTKEQMVHLNRGRKSWGDPAPLSAIQEINTTGSILSDFSYSRSEDDLDSSKCFGSAKEWKKPRPNTDRACEPATKKRKSSSNKVVEIGATETLRATTTLTVPKDGPITATSVIESIPKMDDDNLGPCENVAPANLVFESWARQESKLGTPTVERNNTNLRQHYLQQKTVVMPESCFACEKRIRFSRSALKCKECGLLCHIECKNILPLPCVPVMHTPSKRKFMGTVSDYTPMTPPMVPGLIVHCVNEIEQRGLEELGIYRVPGSEKDVKGLKEKFLTCRTNPNLKEVDIHVICGCVKDFLRSLSEPLLTYNLWKDFVHAVKAKDEQDIAPCLYQTISELPQPNRDTLAFMVLHLQKISESPDCKMPVENLARVFGPTLVGYSSDDPSPNQLVEETRYIVKVMEHLIRLPLDFWLSFVNVNPAPTVGRLQQTPSTDSLLRPTTSRIFTPSKSDVNRFKKKKEGRIFATPPMYK